MIHDTTAPLSRSLRLLVLTIGLVFMTGFLVGLPACGDDETTAPTQDDGNPLTVQVLDNSFLPKTLTITVGDSVTWRWQGSNPHTVTHGTGPGNLGGDFDSPQKTSGTFGYRFTTQGSVPYFCRLHVAMGMTGTIVVNTP